TAHVLECLVERAPKGRAIQRALSYIAKAQESDGAWYGRWGVDYIYGTAQVLVALGTLGEGRQRPSLRRGVAWLVSHQNQDGGWGETCRSYDDPIHSRGIGPSTASQTAWAITGLTATAGSDHPAVTTGVEYLLRTQREDGSWEEEAYTGTGFPRAFYLRYDMYRLHFPLLALARYKVDREQTR
ncbi:MAG: hypothetical protein M0Z94_06940, partial [Dehalococcoidales bacterium]|nr:hypothetical protein [Dehalococcoidales bacterium]